MARMHEGGYGLGQLRLAGNCKKCKVITMVDIVLNRTSNRNQNSNSVNEQLNGSLCERCHEEEFGLQAQREKKLEALFASKKKWWEFWKD
jgi:hypothetical protein